MQALIPLYDLSYAQQILDNAKKYKLSVIINPNDGPGESLDKQWKKLIDDLIKTGNVTIYGYIDMVTWDKSGKNSKPKSISDLVKERELYKKWYNVTKFFLDDFSDKMKRPFSDFCIANPGYDLKTDCDITLIFEKEGYLKSKESKISGSKSAVFAMGEKDFKPALDLAKKRGIMLFYAVSASDNWQAYDKLPAYFNELIKNIK